MYIGISKQTVMFINIIISQYLPAIKNAKLLKILYITTISFTSAPNCVLKKSYITETARNEPL